MEQLKDVARYCAEHIEGWDAKCDLALDAIGNGMPIDWEFRNEIEGRVDEWCEDNDVALDFFEEWDEIAREIIMTEL